MEDKVDGGWHVVGVDPGVQGGWAMLRVGGSPTGRAVLVDYGRTALFRGAKDNRLDPVVAAGAFRRALRGYAPPLVIEEVGGAPGQGVASTATLMHAAGLLEGVLVGLGVREVVRVAPAAWKAGMGLRGGKAGKGQSVALAEKLTGVRLGEHEAEAALLAWFAVTRGLCDGRKAL
ncbi:hypothetical protein [Microcystis phage MJing1]|nr:hypothetical protein [Microcystis phage MJing1]